MTRSTPTPTTAPPIAATPAWVEAAQRRVFRYLRCLRCPRDLAADFVQETLLQALREQGKSRGPAEPREPAAEPTLPWLLTVARNLWLSHCRRVARAPSPADLQQLHERAVTELGDDGGDAAVAALRHCVAGLPARSRQALDLCYRDGLPRATAAARLGLGDDGLKSLLARLRAALKECIERKRDHDER